MSQENVKILFVDDEVQFVDTLVKRLGLRGVQAEAVYNGPDALTAIAKTPPPDVIVLDLYMPDMDGFAVLREVKKINPQIQVIILTGHGEEKEEEMSYTMGAYSFLKKPIDIDDLLKAVNKAFKQKLEDSLVAASLAQAGDFSSAKDIMNEQDLKI